MEELVVTPLDALEASLGALLTSLTTTPTLATAPAASTAVLAADNELTTSLALLKTHQQNYAKILRLRAEASHLEEQIKSIVRTCGKLRAEIGAINPSILEDSSDDEEGEGAGRRQDVDYTTLLSFARRIGKHNTRAARDVEQDSIRRRQDAKERSAAAAASLTAANGVGSPSGAEVAVEVGNIIPENEQAWLNETAAAARAAQGMAFPAAERLRMGLLGQLQYAREQGGEDAVEREVERLMGRQVSEDESASEERAVQSTAMVIDPTETHAQQPQAPSTSSASNARPLRPPERKKDVAPLNLDLWNEDEDDD